MRWDAGTYFILGTSLAEGKGYRLLNEPGQIEAIQYPPLLPAIIAIEERILGSQDPTRIGIALRWTFLAFSLLYIACGFLFARLFLPRLWAVSLALICLLNYQMYFMSTLCFSELPFAFTSTLFGCLYFRKKQGRIVRLLVPCAAVASYLLRSIGIALLAAWVTDAVLRKQYRSAAMRSVMALIPIILWQYHVHSVESRPEYKRPYYAYQRDPSMFYNVSYAANVSLKDPFRPALGKASTRDFIDRFLGNLPSVPTDLGEAVSSIGLLWKGHLRALNGFLKPFAIPPWPIDFCLALLGWLVIGGIAYQLWRGPRFVALFLLLTVAAICMTPWAGQVPRYMAPVEPFLLLALFACVRGLREAAGRISAGRARRIAGGVTLLIILLLLTESAISLIGGVKNFRASAIYEDAGGAKKQYWLWHYPPSFASVEAALKWISAHANPHAVVAISMPHWAYLRTGLTTVMPPFETDPFKAEKLLYSVPVTYLVLEDMIMEDQFNTRFSAVIRKSLEKWALVYKSADGHVSVYQRIGSPT